MLFDRQTYFFLNFVPFLKLSKEKEKAIYIFCVNWYGEVYFKLRDFFLNFSVSVLKSPEEEETFDL